MRAIYSEEILENPFIEGEEAHHLLNVVRIKKGEEILILNGKGIKIKAKVLNLEKNKVNFQINETINVKKKDQIHLAIGLPKKEAFEEVLRNSMEMGISQIYHFKSQFSQQDFEINERVKKILISSMIQSNNPYFLGLDKLDNLNSLFGLLKDYNKVLYFCSHSNFSSKSPLVIKADEKILLIIGPEGGFSPNEEDFLLKSDLIKTINLPSFILRTQNAVTASAGWVMGKLS